MQIKDKVLVDKRANTYEYTLVCRTCRFIVKATLSERLALSLCQTPCPRCITEAKNKAKDLKKIATDEIKKDEAAQGQAKKDAKEKVKKDAVQEKKDLEAKKAAYKKEQSDLAKAKKK